MKWVTKEKDDTEEKEKGRNIQHVILDMSSKLQFIYSSNIASSVHSISVSLLLNMYYLIYNVVSKCDLSSITRSYHGKNGAHLRIPKDSLCRVLYHMFDQYVQKLILNCSYDRCDERRHFWNSCIRRNTQEVAFIWHRSKASISFKDKGWMHIKFNWFL